LGPRLRGDSDSGNCLSLGLGLVVSTFGTARLSKTVGVEVEIFLRHLNRVDVVVGNEVLLTPFPSRLTPNADGVTRNDFRRLIFQPTDLQAKVAMSVGIGILLIVIFQRKEIKREFESGRQERSRL